MDSQKALFSIFASTEYLSLHIWISLEFVTGNWTTIAHFSISSSGESVWRIFDLYLVGDCDAVAQRPFYVSTDQTYIEYYPTVRHLFLINRDNFIINSCLASDIEFLFFHLVRSDDMRCLALWQQVKTSSMLPYKSIAYWCINRNLNLIVVNLSREWKYQNKFIEMYMLL
jgi:hypothetical protein